MKTKKAFLCIFSCFLFFSCEFLDYKEKDEVLPEIEDGKGGSYFEDSGELTSSGTNFEAPWTPGDIWNYGGGYCNNEGTHKDKDKFCVDINYINGGYSDLGMPFLAIFDGVIVENRFQFNSNIGFGYGFVLSVKSFDGELKLRMAHLKEKSFFEIGEKVKKGQVLGYYGKSGGNWKPHGHYCIYKEKVNNECSKEWCSTPFENISNITFSDYICKTSYQNIKSTNDFEFKRIEEEFGTNFFGDILYNNLGYRGIHWYYDFVVNGSTSFSSTNQNNVLIQDWQNSSENRRSVIVYDVLHGARRGYVVHSGFAEDPNHGWLQDSSGVNTSGPRSKLGVPLSNEFVENGRTYQNFMFGYLTWRNNLGVSYNEYPTDGYTVGEVSQSLVNDVGSLTVKVKVPGYIYSAYWSKKFSYLFVDSFNKSQKDGHWLGFPIVSSFTNEASVDYVSSMPNYYKYFIQEFYNTNKSFLQNSAIIYDPDNNTGSIRNGSKILGGEHKAYVVRDGFWSVYKQVKINNRDAFDYCGAPVMDESIAVPFWVQYEAGNVLSHQVFERCFMAWGDTQNINIYIYNNGLFDCYNFIQDPNDLTKYITSYCGAEPCTEENNQGNNYYNSYCDEFQQLYCWDKQTCNGSGYFSPDIWSPVLPEELPPKCTSSYGLQTQYPKSWECCCGFPIDWDGSGGNNCVGKWGEYGDVELVGTAPELNPPPPEPEQDPIPLEPEPELSCPRTCLPGMKFQCWDMSSCENYGSGYGSPPLWNRDCYLDTPPNCGNWSGGIDYKPTYWQCCCGYDVEWFDGQNNACRSSVYNSFN